MTTVTSGAERFRRPQSLRAAALLMRQRLETRYPLISCVGKQLARTRFAFGVQNGSDVINHLVKRGEELPEIMKQAELLAVTNGYKLGRGQTESAILAQSIVGDPSRLRAGDELFFHVVGQAEGALADVRQIITGLSSRQLSKIFSHHLLDDLICSPLDCLALATEDLGIAREDFSQDWSTLASSVRIIRRGTFRHDQELADEVPAAERLLSGGQTFTPDVLKWLNDVRLKVIERVNPRSLLGWGLSGHGKSEFMRSAVKMRKEAFRFIADPIFDPLEALYRRCRERTFQYHPQREFLAHVYERLTSPGYDTLPVQDIDKARELVESVTSQNLEKWRISHHWTDNLPVAIKPLDLYYAAFSLFGVKRTRPEVPSIRYGDHRYRLALDPNISDRKSERLIIERTIEIVCLCHPQGASLFETFSQLNCQETIAPVTLNTFREVLSGISLAAMKKWGVRLPAWLAEDNHNAADLFALVFSQLEPDKKIA